MLGAFFISGTRIPADRKSRHFTVNFEVAAFSISRSNSNCGGTWEVYHRDLHSRHKKARVCPHCSQKIDEQTWDNQIFPAYNALDDVNRELFKDHLGYHVPLFEVSYESNTIFKNAKNWPSYSDDDDSSDIE